MKDDDCSSPGQTRVICYLPTITLPRDPNLSACFFEEIARPDRSIGGSEDTSPSPCRLYRSLKYILCTEDDKYLRTVFLPPLEVSPFVPHLRIFRIRRGDRIVIRR